MTGVLQLNRWTCVHGYGSSAVVVTVVRVCYTLTTYWSECCRRVQLNIVLWSTSPCWHLDQYDISPVPTNQN